MTENRFQPQVCSILFDQGHVSTDCRLQSYSVEIRLKKAFTQAHFERVASVFEAIILFSTISIETFTRD